MLGTAEKIPSHLRTYVVKQDYEKYTFRDHAVWRFIMRNAKDFMVAHAHPAYLLGLEKTGVPIEQIPRISEMDERFSQFGWGTVCVCGFIPPLAFLEFLSHRILPIAADMRTLEHFDYTPAPDIVHEAAGHAPILADKEYRDYMASYAKVARKGIFSNEDVRLYEAIRVLSDVKENPDSTPETIQKAEQELKKAYNSMTWVSEAAQISRMFWWTIEYGLVGEMQKPLLYGAGLLSSIGESLDCFDSRVQKVPFSLKCVETGYDITEPQPQLFVAKDFHHVSEVLRELEATLAFRKGGEESLALAKRAESLTTTQLDSGVEISGVLSEFVYEKGRPVFLRWKGPVQVCCQGQELADQGVKRHPDGFSSPVGFWSGTPLHPKDIKDSNFAKLGLHKGSASVLNLSSGFKISGVLKAWVRDAAGSLLLVTWQECTVTRGDKTYFEPSWGEFDQVVGDAVPSVYGGPADWAKYGSGDFGKASTQPGRLTPYREQEKHLFALYGILRNLRLEKQPKQAVVLKQLEKICDELISAYPNEWLLGIEVSEQFYALGCAADEAPWFRKMQEQIFQLSNYSEKQRRFVKMGLDLAKKTARR